jgi:hypothetical protein
MTTTIPNHPLSFLFGETKDSAAALAHVLDEQDVLGAVGGAVTKLSQAGRDVAGGEVATVAQGLLDLDLGDLLVAGWCKHADLVAAAKSTIAVPGSSEVVELAAHSITSVHQPSVDVLVNDLRVATVRFELRVEFKVQALVATVRRGHLVAFRSGGCEVAVALGAEGRQLVRRQARLDLPLVLRLGNGVSLLRDAEQPLASR